MNPRVRAIAKLEARLYLRSVGLWLGIGVIWLGVFGTSSVRLAGPIEHYLRHGDALAVLLTAFVATLVISAGFARESRESFDDVWNSLPTRNTEQVLGKALGAGAVVAVLGIGILIIIPIGWQLIGSMWTPAATVAALAFTAQTVAVLLLSLGIATLLRSLIGNVRIRYAAALGIVATLSVAQALGIDNDAIWAVLLSPYSFGLLPYSYSSLYGMFPWGEVVVWHIAFQILLSLLLMVLGGVLYERRRDPAKRSATSVAALALLLVGCGFAGVKYERFWHGVDVVFGQQLEYDTKPATPMIQLPNGDWVRQERIVPFKVAGYDLTVEWLPGPTLDITAVLTVDGDGRFDRWPFTLHHQWEIKHVGGEGVLGWQRDGNMVWLELAPGMVPSQVTFEYSGQPFLWDKQIGVINPMHFISDQGGYLSPLMAWYPLPGERRLVIAVLSGRYWTRPADEPLLPGPVPMQVTWYGPAELNVVSNLDSAGALADAGGEKAVLRGQSDGVSLFIGSLDTLQSGDFTLLGAPSILDGSETLAAAYRELMMFYDDLMGRPIPRRPIVAVPSWLKRFYVTYHTVPVNGRGHSRQIESLPLLGENPAVSETGISNAAAAAKRWLQTKQPTDLLEATESIHYGVLQTIWGRPYTHLTFLTDPVSKGLAEYTLLRWVEYVGGFGDKASLRERAASYFENLGPLRSESEEIADRVLKQLLQLEESAGAEAVTRLLGAVYDHLETAPLDLAGFETLLQQAREGVLP